MRGLLLNILSGSSLYASYNNKPVTLRHNDKLGPVVSLMASYFHRPCEHSFAILTPDNIVSKKGFDKVAQAAYTDPDTYVHAQHFMCIKENTEENDDDSSALPPLSDGDDYSIVESVDQPKWTGFYTLCLCKEHQPQQPFFGWAVGCGNPKLPYTGGIDLRLDMSKRMKSGLSRRHAYLDFSVDGQFCVRADNPEGRTDIKSINLNGSKFNRDLRVIASLGPTQLNFREYNYVFCFTDLQQQESWNNSCRGFLQGRANNRSLPPLINFTPTPSDRIISGRWSIRSTVATGSYGFVSRAVDLNRGTSFAAKLFNCTNKVRREEAEHEILMMKDKLPNHPGLAQYYDQFEEVGAINHASWIYLFITPLTDYTLDQYMHSPDFKQSQSIDLLKQLLGAVDALHASCIVHRDLKPTNIGIMWIKDRLITIIFDFGQTILNRGGEIEPQRNMIGTRPYLAPEMEERNYDSQVDIWALGVIWAQLILTRGETPWADIQDITHTGRKSRSKRLLAFEHSYWTTDATTNPRLLRIEEQDERVTVALPQLSSDVEPEYDLIRQLLRCDPKERCAARKAVSHACFNLKATVLDTVSRRFISQGDASGSKRAVNEDIIGRDNGKRVWKEHLRKSVDLSSKGEGDFRIATTSSSVTELQSPWRHDYFHTPGDNSALLAVGPHPESSGILAHPERAC